MLTRFRHDFRMATVSEFCCLLIILSALIVSGDVHGNELESPKVTVDFVVSEPLIALAQIVLEGPEGTPDSKPNDSFDQKITQLFDTALAEYRKQEFRTVISTAEELVELTKKSSNSHSSDRLAAMLLLVAAQKKVGEYSKARSLITEVEAEPGTLPNDTTSRILYLRGAGEIRRLSGEYREAAQDLEDAAKLSMAVQEAEPTICCMALLEACQAARRIGNIDAAWNCWRLAGRVRAAHWRFTGKDCRIEEERAAGEIHLDTKDFVQAEASLSSSARLLPEKPAPGQEERHASILLLLAKSRNAISRQEEAMELVTQAKLIAQDYFDRTHPILALGNTIAAKIQMDLGNYEQAMDFANDACLTQNQTLGPAHPDVAETCEVISEYLLRCNRKSEAEQYLLQACAIYKKSDAKVRLAWALLNLHHVRLPSEDERYNDDIKFVLEVFSFLDSGHPGKIAVSLHVADQHHNSGHYDAAAKLLENLTEHAARTTTLRRMEHVGILARLGNTLYELGRYEEAVTALEQAIELAKLGDNSVSMSFDDIRTVSTAKLLLGQSHCRLKRYEDARKELQSAVGLIANIEHTEFLLATLHYNLGAVYLWEEQYEKAKSGLRKSIELMEKSQLTQQRLYIESLSTYSNVLKHLDDPAYKQTATKLQRLADQEQRSIEGAKP